MTAKINLDIPCLLEKHYLYNNEESFGEFVRGKIVSMTAHPGKRPTFDFLIEGQGIFCDLPIYAFCSHYPLLAQATHDEEALNPEICPQDVSGVYGFTYEALCDQQLSIFERGKRGPMTHEGSYVTSVEFPHGNELWHIIAIEGRLGMVANQRMLIGLHEERPRYKRLERDYSAL